MQITHGNLIAAALSANALIQFPEGARVVSYLPMAHIAERQCTHYLPMVFAWSVTCCPDPRQVVAYLPEVRPTWFFAVPRIFEKLKAAFEAGVEAEQDEEKKTATKWAIGVGYKRVRGRAGRGGDASGARRGVRQGRCRRARRRSASGWASTRSRR